MSQIQSLANEINSAFTDAFAQAEAKTGGWKPDDGTYSCILEAINVSNDNLTFNMTSEAGGASTPAFGVSYTWRLRDDPSSPDGPRAFRSRMEVLPKNPAAIKDPGRINAANTKMGVVKGQLQTILGHEVPNLVTALLELEALIAESVKDGGTAIVCTVQVKTNGKFVNYYINGRES